MRSVDSASLSNEQTIDLIASMAPKMNREKLRRAVFGLIHKVPAGFSPWPVSLVCSCEFLNGLLELASPGQCHTKIDVSVVIIGIKFSGFYKGVDCFLVLAIVTEFVAAQVEVVCRL